MSDYRFFVALHEAEMPTFAQRSLVTEFRCAILTMKSDRKLRNVLTLIGPSISTFDLTSCAILKYSHSELRGIVTEAVAKVYVQAHS
jgi:hypothetical protein